MALVRFDLAGRGAANRRPTVTRLVDLGGDNAKHFRWLYQSLLIGAALKKHRPSETMKMERKILRKFKAISDVKMQDDEQGRAVPVLVAETQEPDRVPHEGAVVELELEQVKLLVEYIESIPWLVTKAEVAFDALEHMETSPKSE
jgi:hypothetical protein